MCNWLKRSIILLPLITGGCKNASPPADKAASSVHKVHFDEGALTFKHPQTGHVFHLHLRDELHQDTGGVTSVPSNIKEGMRDATSSYYEPEDENGSTLAPAESSYHHDLADIVVRNTTIQFQADSGRLLITEDKGDGLPCRRYILYTSLPGGGYRVTYLAPACGHGSSNAGFPVQPPDVELLPDGKARIKGKVLNVEDIDQSTSPFSLGG